MIKSGARPTTAHQVHRTIRTALGEARRRGHVSRNVAALAKPPRVQVEPVRPYSVDEVQRILQVAMQRPTAHAGRSHSLSDCGKGRPGLTLDDVDLETRSLQSEARGHARSMSTGAGGTCGPMAGSVDADAEARRISDEYSRRIVDAEAVDVERD